MVAKTESKNDKKEVGTSEFQITNFTNRIKKVN